MSRLIGKRTKETPKDAQTQSHIFLIRGGYIRPVSSGIFSMLPLAKIIAQKIEKIIREEMGKIEGQEVMMPVVLPRELWDESGRYDSVGPELLRFKDRNSKDMLLGMTHEEAVVHLVRNEVNSYKQLPFMAYQIQTKYRDEARPRAGLIRVREFTMKDAYSFHATDEDLKNYYERAHEAYVRIFKRVGMKNVVSIESDTGMMGGAASHEFMAIADCGEDTLFVSPGGEYKANKEIAKTGLQFVRESIKPLEKVHTPNRKTIEELSTFLNVSESQTGKAIFYSVEMPLKGSTSKQATSAEQVVFVVTRGDLEVNETKLRNYLKVKDLKFATDEQIRSIGSVPGYASPLGLDPKKVRIIFDPSAAQSSNLVVGANETDQHYLNFNFERDMASVLGQIEIADVVAARDGDPCPITGKPLKMERGIEVGNIFQLGTKYSSSMNCTFLDQNGKSKPMIMGCYGIGVGRAISSVIEQSHDQFGPIWPTSIAPYHVHLIALNSNDAEVKTKAEALYTEFLSQGMEVLYDDRNEKAGFAFNDADLIGVPFRLTISPKTLARGVLELKRRDGTLQEDVAVADIISRMKLLIENDLRSLE